MKVELLRAISDNIEDTSVLEPTVNKVIAVLADVVWCKEIRRGTHMEWHCEVRPQLLADVRRYLDDPDDQVERWDWEGAPLGMEAKPEARNIFPVYADQDAAAGPLTLASEAIEGRRGQAEGDEDALKELDFLIQRKRLRNFPAK